jgi:hypothetical protein
VENEFSSIEMEKQSARILLSWKHSKLELEEFYKNRDGERACSVMYNSIELFMEYLNITNGKKGNANMDDFLVSPVNIQERLAFIESRPRLYHSFVQLAELFTEQEKLFAKKLALYKLKNKRPD